MPLTYETFETVSSPPSDAELVRQALETVADLAPAKAAGKLGVSTTTLAEWRRGVSNQYKLRFENRQNLLALLGLAGGVAGTPIVVGAGIVAEPVPIYGLAQPREFAEHVLFTAGRIAELAGQIELAARKQIGLTNELGQRATPLSGAPSGIKISAKRVADVARASVQASKGAESPPARKRRRGGER